MTIRTRNQRQLPPSLAVPFAQNGTAGSGNPSELAVASRGLTKRFRNGQLAVDHIDLTVPRGSVYGFLGPNGSGKTTTMRMLLGLAFPTSGDAELLSVPVPSDIARVLPKVGSLIEGPGFYPFMTGQQNLARWDAADRIANPRTSAARISEALNRVGLLPAAGKRYRHYSLGMKQRLAIAASLLMPRELILLDEPTNGLDPQGTREVRELIKRVAADGVTVFLSSHLLAEIEQICSHFGVMRAGRLVFQGTLEELRGTAAARIRVETAEPSAAGAVLERLGCTELQITDDAALAHLADIGPEEICEELMAAKVRVRGLAMVTPNLEELFVELTGKGFEIDD